MVGSSPAPSAARLPKGYRNDRYFGLIYDSVPSGADDLTIIPGIATREAVTLNRMGIYFVPQIATWRHHHVVAFAAELQIPPTQIVSERWVENAQSLCAEPLVAQTSAPPAPFLRTLAILTCAMMIGLFLVYFMGNRTATPLHGVLSADITAIRVPADSKLLASHVKAGDEVFSSTPLLTLEKVSHQKLIQDQQSRVQQLQNELRQAEAQSELELAWRSRELERELYDVRVQTQIIQEVQKQSRPSVPTAALEEPPVEHSGSNRTRLASVSRSRDVAQRAAIPAGGIVFFSGASGESTMESGLSAASVGLPPRPVPTQVAQARPLQLAEPKIVSAASPATTVASSAMAENLEARINRLESLRSVLPEQVRQAAGIENMRARLQDATALLDQMKEVSREVSVTSPGYGVVGQVRFREGDNLPEGEVMLKILHTDRRYVVVYVPTRRVNELQPGSEVKLSFPGGQQFRGQVTDLPMLAESLTPAGESLVAVRIDPVGRLWPHVPIGSQVDVAAVN